MFFDQLNECTCRVLWKKEGELNREIEKLKADTIKADKSMDLAAPGVRLFPHNSSDHVLFLVSLSLPLGVILRKKSFSKLILNFFNLFCNYLISLSRKIYRHSH